MALIAIVVMVIEIIFPDVVNRVVFRFATT